MAERTRRAREIFRLAGRSCSQRAFEAAPGCCPTLQSIGAFRVKVCESRAHLELSPVGSKIAEKKRVMAPAARGCIEIRGARQNNLKGIDIDLPLGRLTVVTGPSGSGKSSLAFETIYAE